ncbi:hypothetical protein [Roseivivax marinus]|uniref:hypothetical protein n=1 Tax=Roseivivax marinus TaxID=1379903 RepID=UPI00273E0B63|nr:hypothetical protein [Roseivivax marinus]
MIDEEMENLSPYQEILNHPDPDRALAGMRIMLEQGDATLRRMALEYGLLSPSPQVRKAALDGYLRSEPILAVSFDGSEIKDGSYEGVIEQYHSGTIDQSRTGYWKLAISGYDEAEKCYQVGGGSGCGLSITENGVFITPTAMNGRATFSDDGQLVGTATMTRIDSPVPFTVKLID